MENTKKIESAVQNWIERIEKKSKKKENSKQNSARIFLLAGNIGFSMSLPLVGGVLLGYFLDNRYLTSPRMTLVFLFVGFCIGCYSMYKILKELEI